MSLKPKVLVIGSGGVGSVTALSLWWRQRLEVTLIVRSDYELIKAKGIEFHSCSYGHIEGWQPHNLSSSVSDAARDYGPFDYVVLTTKNIPDGPIRCEDIVRDAITTGVTTLILVQNGIGIEKAMYAAFPEITVLSGVQLIGSSYENGVVYHRGADNLSIGDFASKENRSSKSDEVMKRFVEIYQNDDGLNEIKIDNDPQASRWKKLVYNAAFNATSALAGVDNTRCQIAAGTDSLIRPAMREIIKIAKSEGVVIQPDVMDVFCHLGDGMFYTPSMGIDRKKGQLMEIEVILGNPLATARANGVETPVLDTLYALLRMVQLDTMEKRGQISIDEKDYAGNSDDYQRIFNDKRHERLG